MLAAGILVCLLAPSLASVERLHQKLIRCALLRTVERSDAMRSLLSILVLLGGACAETREADLAIRDVTVVDVTDGALAANGVAD